MRRPLITLIIAFALLPLGGFMAEKIERKKPVGEGRRDGDALPKVGHDDSGSISADDAEVLEALGASLYLELVKNFDLSEGELNFFLQGLRKGHQGDIDRESLRKMNSRIQAFVRPRMEGAQARERERDKARLADLRLPMDMEIATSTGEKTTLGKLVAGKKAALIDFWASWCGPCMSLMPELQKKAEKYGPKGIVVAGMNTENAEKAEGVRSKRGIEFPWLVEPEGRPLSQMLNINSIPRMILVNPEGRVLFNGHPMDNELTTALAELAGK